MSEQAVQSQPRKGEAGRTLIQGTGPATGALIDPAAVGAPVALAPAPVQLKPIVPLKESQFTICHDAGGRFGRIWGAEVPDNVEVADLLEDAYWANKAPMFRRNDFIWVVNPSGRFVELRVRDTRTVGAGKDANRATVEITRVVEGAPVPGSVDVTPWEITFKGRDKKWCVVRASDKEIIREGFSMPDDADLMRRILAQDRAKRAA